MSSVYRAKKASGKEHARRELIDRGHASPHLPELEAPVEECASLLTPGSSVKSGESLIFTVDEWFALMIVAVLSSRYRFSQNWTL